MLRIKETRHISWHETCTCKCRLDVNVCINKQRWNNDKCRYECKELIQKSRCDKGLIWNFSICDCECDKSCDIGEDLDYGNCKCRKKLIDKLGKECDDNIDGNERICNASLNDYKRVCKSYTMYITLFIIFSIISISTSSEFIYFFGT